MKQTLPKRILRYACYLYVVVTLPVMAVFVKSEYVRFITVQTVTHWRGKFTHIPYAYLGDSLIVGGRNWGQSFRALNLGGNGYQIHQIQNQVGRAKKAQPEVLILLAGTNNVLSEEPFEETQFRSDYESLLDAALEVNAILLVTEIPFTSRRDHQETIKTANGLIREIADARDIETMNLNHTLAPDGVLLPYYTTDGVHLSPPAYRFWRKEIARVIEEME